MNFFEKELCKTFQLCEKSFPVVDNPVFVGGACYGDISVDLRARIEFVDPHIKDHFDHIEVSVLNRKDGVVDRLSIGLEDILGRKAVPGNKNFPDGVEPYIWVYNGKADWYVFKPDYDDYKEIKNAVGEYVNVFRSLEEREKRQSLAEQISDAEKQGCIKKIDKSIVRNPERE